MKIQCLPSPCTSSQKSMPEIQQLHSEGQWLPCFHRAENDCSKGNLYFSPPKTLDSHICCLLDPELSIFSPHKNIFFFLGSADSSWKLGSEGQLLTIHLQLVLNSPVSQTEEQYKLKITEQLSEFSAVILFAGVKTQQQHCPRGQQKPRGLCLLLEFVELGQLPKKNRA